MHRPNAKAKLYVVTAVIVALALIALYFSLNAPAIQSELTTKTVTEDVPSSVPAVSGDIADVVSFSVAPNSVMSGKMSVGGALKGGYFYEGTARGFLLDANKNTLSTFPLKSSGDWTTSGPVMFTAAFDATGLSGAGYIRLENDNPSGDPAKDKHIDIPVVFK